MKTIFKLKFAKPLIFALTLTSLLSCSKIDDPVIVEGDAKLRVVNAVSGSNPQEVYQDGTKISTSSISYAQSTDYLKVKGGVTTVLALRNENSTNITTNSIVGLNVNGSYTAFYYSSLGGNGKIGLLMDDTSIPATGKSKVRFVNLGAALNNTINVGIVGGSSIFTGLGYENASNYQIIDANTSLNVTVLGGDTKVIPGSEFQSGKTYYVWIDAANSTSVNYHLVAQN